MRSHPSVVLLLGCAIVCAAQADAQSKTEDVQFADGANSATVKGAIDGYGTVTYVLDAQAGQAARVVFKPDNGDCEFIVYSPGQRPGVNEAFFNGSNRGNEFTGILPSTGKYSVWVGLSSRAARGLQRCSYSISFSLKGAPS